MTLVFTSYISSPEYDQPETWLRRINAYTGILERLGTDHRVIGIERINYEGEYEQKGVKYYFIRPKKKVILFPGRLHRLVKELQPDVVFINGLIFPLQVIQLRLRLGRSVKVILIHHAEKPFKGIKRYLQRLADRCVDAYFFTSSEFGTQWIHNGNLENKKKIHETMEVSSVFSPMNKTAAKAKLAITGEPVFLWVGRLDQNKNPLTVVKAFIRFIEHQPGAKLYMIYQTTELLREIEDLAEENVKWKESICLIGKIPHDQLGYWYNSADFIISGSYYEGSGVAVCEAMSCGCIPILTDIVSFRKMTGPGKCGLLYKAGDEEELLSALLQTKKLDKDKERARVLEQFQKELSFEAIAREIHRVITSL